MSAHKRAKKIRQAQEIKRVTTALAKPKWDTGVFSWSLEEIRKARDAQMRGEFKLACALADSFKTDESMFVALKNRLDALDAIGYELVAGPGKCGEYILREANDLFGPDGVAVTAETLRDIRMDRVNHAVAIGHIIQQPRDDGSRIDYYLEHWPLKHCRFDKQKQCLVTQVEGATGEVEIHHGDGEWVVFATSENEPWKKDAAVLPGALVWAAHAFAANDWTKGSRSHGNAKVVGEMPEGYAIEDEDGLTREAQQFLVLLGAIANDDGPSGIKPYGSKLEYLVNSSSAWQVWQALMDNRERAAARIYLGTDGTLGAQGGAPGVDITALFGVSAIVVQGDLKKDRAALNTGLIGPWCATNHGDSSAAPTIRFLTPDQDEEAVRTNYADRSAKFQAAIKETKANGFVVDQQYVNQEAQKYGINPPQLPCDASPDAAASIEQTAQQATASKALADKMTSAQVERCVHNGVNVCRICGIKKAYDFDTDGDGLPNKDEAGNTNWKFTWVPI